MPATDVSTLIYKIIWDDSDASKGRDAWDKGMESSIKSGLALADTFLDMGKSMADFTIDAVKNFAQFEDTLSHARRTMGLTREETLALGDSLMDMATDFSEGGLAAGVAVDELAKISGILGQLGFSAKDNAAEFNSLVATIAKVGVAFGMTNEKAAEGLGILSNLYNLPVEQISNAASSIAYLGNTTVATAGQIVDVMQRMGGIAGLLGVSAQEAAALAATLRESGVSAQVAGTAMSQIFSRLSSDVDRFGEVLAKGGVSAEMLRMKIESGDATEALKMVLQGIQNINQAEGKIAAIQALKDLGLSGVRVQQALLGLSNNLGGLNENLKASEKAFKENTAVNEAYEAAIDNTQQKMTQFTNLLDVIQKIIGKDLALVFSDFLEKHLIPFTDHFKTWLETSEGAEAIFGKSGIIAQGLEWVGSLLTDNEEAIFKWADTLDTVIPEAIEYLKGKFQDFIDWIKTDVPSVAEAWDKTIKAIQDVDAAIQKIQEAWTIFIDTIKGSLQTLENIGKPLQVIFEPIARMREESDRMSEKYGDNMADISRAINIANDAMGEFVETTNEARDVGDKLEEEWVTNSHLPEIVNALEDVYDTGHNTFSNLEKDISATDAVFQRAQVPLTETPGRLDDIYRTGYMTFSNLGKEVDEFSTKFERSNQMAIAGNREHEFALYETANAVSNLGDMYGQVAEATGSATQALYEYKDIFDTIAPKGPNLSEQFVNEQTAGNQATLSAIGGNFRNLGADALESLRKSGTLTASGQIGATKAQRGTVGSEFDPKTGFGTIPPLNITLQMDNQQVATMNAVLDDNKQQQGRRSFSRSSGGFSSGGGGF